MQGRKEYPIDNLIRVVTFFNPLLYQGYIHPFLTAVVNSNHALIKKTLEDYPKLIFQRGKIEDPAHRTFDNISGFEYALWAKDKAMWTMMLEVVKELPKEERIAIVKELLKQYKNIKEGEGLKYTLNGEVKTEKHYDFDIINQLQIQVDSQKATGEKDWEAINKQWCEDVGGAQNLFPMNIVHFYCCDVPFSPIPDFNIPPQQRNKKFSHYIDSIWVREDWFVAE